MESLDSQTRRLASRRRCRICALQRLFCGALESVEPLCQSCLFKGVCNENNVGLNAVSELELFDIPLSHSV